MKLPFAFFTALSLTSLAALNAADDLAEHFTNPPAEARPWCYWYWMNGNVTREGIIADLQAMHEVGIGGVFLMDIGIHPAGPVAYHSRQWYDLVKLAVSEAQKHGIQVSFHCPGWSASGGPWVTPEMAMQELTWSETHVDGGRELAITLPQPPTKLGYYRDIAVLAFPTRDGDDWTLRDLKPAILDITGQPVRGAAAAFDGDTNTAATLPEQFDLIFDRPISARTIFIRAARANGGFRAKLQAWDEARGTFRQVAQVQSNTSGPFSAQIGATTFPAVKASRFRLDFDSRKPGERAIIEELDLRGGYRDPQWVAKTGFATDQVASHGEAEQLQPGDIIPVDQVLDLTKNIRGVRRQANCGLRLPGRARSDAALRLGHTPTGIKIAPAPAGGDGLECDKLSREAADFHYDHFLTPLLKELGPELRKALACQHVDSYEAGWQNWTETFPQEIQGPARLRSDAVLAGRNGAHRRRMRTTTEQFLWDFRRTIGDLFADNHYGRLAERSHQDGLGFSTEPYGGPVRVHPGRHAGRLPHGRVLAADPAGRPQAGLPRCFCRSRHGRADHRGGSVHLRPARREVDQSSIFPQGPGRFHLDRGRQSLCDPCLGPATADRRTPETRPDLRRQRHPLRSRQHVVPSGPRVGSSTSLAAKRCSSKASMWPT